MRREVTTHSQMKGEKSTGILQTPFSRKVSISQARKLMPENARPPQPDPIGVAEARMVLSLADSHCTLS